MSIWKGVVHMELPFKVKRIFIEVVWVGKQFLEFFILDFHQFAGVETSYKEHLSLSRTIDCNGQHAIPNLPCGGTVRELYICCWVPPHITSDR